MHACVCGVCMRVFSGARARTCARYTCIVCACACVFLRTRHLRESSSLVKVSSRLSATNPTGPPVTCPRAPWSAEKNSPVGARPPPLRNLSTSALESLGCNGGDPVVTPCPALQDSHPWSMGRCQSSCVYVLSVHPASCPLTRIRLRFERRRACV